MNQANEIQLLISNLAFGIPLLPVAVGFSRYRRLSPAQLVLLWLLVAFAVISGISYWFSKPGINLLPLYHVYTLIEFSGYLLLFTMAPSHVLKRREAWAFMGIFGACFLLNFALGGTIYEMPSLVRTVESILLVFVAVFYFYKVFSEMKILRLEREFLFWVCLGLLIMFLGNLLLEIYGERIFERLDVYFDVWTIKNLRELIAYPLITIGMLCKEQQTI